MQIQSLKIYKGNREWVIRDVKEGVYKCSCDKIAERGGGEGRVWKKQEEEKLLTKVSYISNTFVGLCNNF